MWSSISNTLIVFVNLFFVWHVAWSKLDCGPTDRSRSLILIEREIDLSTPNQGLNFMADISMEKVCGNDSEIFTCDLADMIKLPSKSQICDEDIEFLGITKAVSYGYSSVTDTIGIAMRTLGFSNNLHKVYTVVFRLAVKGTEDGRLSLKEEDQLLLAFCFDGEVDIPQGGINFESSYYLLEDVAYDPCEVSKLFGFPCEETFVNSTSTEEMDIASLISGNLCS